MDEHAFSAGLALKDAVFVAAAVVVGAGLSEAAGQSVVLFANRIQPVRFAFCIVISALLFAVGYVFLTLSTWLVSLLPLATHVPLQSLAMVLALSYAPLLFSFFEALPYLGTTITWALRVWHLLAMVVGVAAVAHVSPTVGLLYVGLGWLALTGVRRSLGKPIAELGVKLMDLAAGVSVEEDEDAAVERAQAQMRSKAAGRDGGARKKSAGVGAKGARRLRVSFSRWQIVGGIIALIFVALVVAVAMQPVHGALFGWDAKLPVFLRLPMRLLWVALIAVITAAIFAPLESLGWWAGWYGDAVKPKPPKGGHKAGATHKVSRYIIYLDGVGESSTKYTPDVETFLDALEPTLPKDVKLLRGLQVYSVLNRPLDDDPMWSRFWKFVDRVRIGRPSSVLGMFINVRNVLIVAVSADPRYGPIYNFGIAQVMYEGLTSAGYRSGSGVPVTLIGYSGGAQMAAGSAPMLKQAIDAPINVISLGGVMSGTCRFFELEHLHHLVGDKDGVERLGRIMFPSRWRVFKFTQWNRALRRGIITCVPLGPVGHQVPGGMFDPKAKLPDGRTLLEHTVDDIDDILNQESQERDTQPAASSKEKN